MKEITTSVAGLDVHRDSVVACCRIREPEGDVTITKESFATTKKGQKALATFLDDAGVYTVVIWTKGVA